MTGSLHPLHLAGRWKDGFDGHHVYLLRAAGEENVKLGTTTDLRRHLTALQEGSPSALSYAVVLPGTAAHKAYLARRFAAERVRGDWYRPEALLDFAASVQQQLSASRSGSGREAMLDALADLDPVLGDLERMHQNGASVPEIVEHTGLSENAVKTHIKQMRAMRFDLTLRVVRHVRATSLGRAA